MGRKKLPKDWTMLSESDSTPLIIAQKAFLKALKAAGKTGPALASEESQVNGLIAERVVPVLLRPLRPAVRIIRGPSDDIWAVTGRKKVTDGGIDLVIAIETRHINVGVKLMNGNKLQYRTDYKLPPGPAIVIGAPVDQLDELPLFGLESGRVIIRHGYFRWVRAEVIANWPPRWFGGGTGPNGRGVGMREIPVSEMQPLSDLPFYHVPLGKK